MLFHELADDTVEGFLAIDCVAVDATGRSKVVEKLEECGREDWVAAWTARLLVLMRILAGHERRETTDVIEHLLHEIIHVLRLSIESLCSVGVAR